MALTESVTLNTGSKMPLLGFGTWQAPKDEIQQCVETAIDVGYRHIDGAWVYQNEEGIGNALAAKIKEGKIKREDIFITSKLWSAFHKPDEVRPSLKESLELLKTDYVDLYLMHWPWAVPNRNKEILPQDDKGDYLFTDVDYVETWKEMEAVYKDGLAKNIGISNFNNFQINRILKECSVVPTVHQIESHPYLQSDDMISFCKSKGIEVTAYSPLGSPQRPWGQPDEPVVMENPTLHALAKKHGKTPAQIMIRFQIQRKVVVIPKSIKATRIKENAQVFDFVLSDEDMKAVASVNKDWRACGMDMIKNFKYWPFSENYSE